MMIYTEDGAKQAHVRCRLGEDVAWFTKFGGGQNVGNPLAITASIALGISADRLSGDQTE